MRLCCCLNFFVVVFFFLNWLGLMCFCCSCWWFFRNHFLNPHEFFIGKKSIKIWIFCAVLPFWFKQSLMKERSNKQKNRNYVYCNHRHWFDFICVFVFKLEIFGFACFLEYIKFNFFFLVFLFLLSNEPN